MLFCPLSQNITARRHYVSLVCMYTIHKYVLIQSWTQTWDLSKNLHDRILALPLSLPVSLWLSMALSGSLWLPLWLYLALTVSLPVSLWLSMAPCNSHSGSLWLSQALTGSRWLLLWFPLTLTATLWLTLAVSCSLISLIQSLIGSQDPCSALSAAATLMHFVLVCLLFSSTYVIWCLNSIHC